jgi:transposase InsO family protein
VIDQLRTAYPIQLLCRVLNYSHSSYYYRRQSREDATLQAQLRETQGQWPTYGYRRLTAQLQRDGLTIGQTRVRRLRKLLHLQAKIKAKKRHTTNSQPAFPRYPNRGQDLTITRPDQVWVCDITWIHLHREDVYLAVIMDVYTRCIRGWQLSRSLDQTLTLTALRRALGAHRPEIHHSDQGVQYAATAYIDLLNAHHVQISMAEVGAAWQNGYAERLMRTIKEEEVDLSDYDDYHDAYQQLGHFLDEVYMHKRIHSSLGYLTPAEFEDQWQAQSAADS